MSKKNCFEVANFGEREKTAQGK